MATETAPQTTVDPAVLADVVTDSRAAIYFDFNSARLNPDGEQALDKLADLITQQHITELHLEAHTDTVGSTRYNNSLSARRDQTVVSALNDRLSTRGVTVQWTHVDDGKANPVVPTGDQVRAAGNRIDVITYHAPVITPPPPPVVAEPVLQPQVLQHDLPVLTPEVHQSLADQMQHRASNDFKGGIHHVGHGLWHLLGDVLTFPIHVIQRGLPRAVAGIAGDVMETVGGAGEIATSVPEEASALSLRVSDTALATARREGDPVAGTIGLGTGAAGVTLDVATLPTHVASNALVNGGDALQAYANGQRRPGAGAAVLNSDHARNAGDAGVPADAVVIDPTRTGDPAGQVRDGGAPQDGKVPMNQKFVPALQTLRTRYPKVKTVDVIFPAPVHNTTDAQITSMEQPYRQAAQANGGYQTNFIFADPSQPNQGIPQPTADTAVFNTQSGVLAPAVGKHDFMPPSF